MKKSIIKCHSIYILLTLETLPKWEGEVPNECITLPDQESAVPQVTVLVQEFNGRPPTPLQLSVEPLLSEVQLILRSIPHLQKMTSEDENTKGPI